MRSAIQRARVRWGVKNPVFDLNQAEVGELLEKGFLKEALLTIERSGERTAYSKCFKKTDPLSKVAALFKELKPGEILPFIAGPLKDSVFLAGAILPE